MTCWVIVDAPWTISPASRLARAARTVAWMSTPLLSQYVRSSLATVACQTTSGSSANFTASRFWHSNRARSVWPVRS